MYHYLYMARRENRMKQVDVAKKLMIHSVTYSRKERGELDFTLKEAFKLSKIFGIPVDELFKGGELDENQHSPVE